MGRSRWTGVIIALVILFFAARALRATTVEPMSLEDMTDRADLVFIGRCVDVRADWNAERSRIFTYATFEVERFLKGGAGDERVTIRVLGGQVGAYQLILAGAPRFVPGEEALVFAAGGGVRVPTVVGLSLGKFTLSRDVSGDRFLKRDISGLMFAHYRTDSKPVGSLPTRFRLEEVEARVRAALVN